VAYRVNMDVGHRDTGSEDKFHTRWCAGCGTSPL
jgi:pyruvate/2-oxoacid:ferredoxin oxidoreductase beta subunit